MFYGQLLRQGESQLYKPIILTMKNLILPVLFALSTSLFSQSAINVAVLVQNAPDQPIEALLELSGDNNSLIYEFEIQGGFYVGDFEEPEFDWDAGWVSIETCNQDSTFGMLSPNALDSTATYFVILDYCDISNTLGCTDPEAINYNPNATVDDGTCFYESDCDENLVAVEIDPMIFASEMSWNIVQDGNVLAEGAGYSNSTPFTEYVCLGDGCYVFQMFDSFGDGWNGGTFSISMEDEILASGSLDEGSYGAVVFSLNAEDCDGTLVFGCTDPEALNYNPDATVDDGSCFYASAENDLCENAIPLEQGLTLIDNSNAPINEDIWGECWNFGSGEGEQSSIWFTITTPDVPAEIHIEAIGDESFTLTDTQFGLFEECGGEMIYCDGNGGAGLLSAFHFECGELEINTTYILMVDGWNGDAGTCFLEYDVSFPCDTAIYGCTDPDAINYNPEANVDDGSCEYFECDANLVEFVLITENWGYEIAWNIRNEEGEEVAGGSNYPSYSTIWETLCLEDGCYEFELFDSFGDGWNGAIFSLSFGDQIVAEGTLDEGEFGVINFGINAEGCDGNEDIYGCTDPFAANYNPSATIDDGSCEYECSPVLFSFDFIGELPQDSSYYWMSWSVINQLTGEGYEDLFYSPASSFELCLPDGCYDFTFYGIPEDWEGLYSVFTENDILATDTYDGSSETHTFTFGVNTEGCGDTAVFGCTDPEALNYNPNATVDDGSCVYSFDCSIDFEVIPDSTGANTYYIIPSENIFQATEVLWDFGDGTTSNELFPTHIYEGDGPYLLCLFVTFADSVGNTCEISYCQLLTGEIFSGAGVLSGGFMVNVIEQGTLSSSELKAVENLNAYPNPTSGFTTLSYESSDSSPIRVTVFDLQGRPILQEQIPVSQGTQLIEIDLSEFSKGLYLIGVQQDRETSFARVVRH